MSGGESHQTTGTGEHAGAGGRPRLRLTPVVETDEVVVRAEPQPHPGGDETTADLDVTFLFDDRDDVDRSAVTITDREVRLPIEAVPGRLRIHAVAVGAGGYSVPDAVTFSRSTDRSTDDDPRADDSSTDDDPRADDRSTDDNPRADDSSTDENRPTTAERTGGGTHPASDDDDLRPDGGVSAASPTDTRAGVTASRPYDPPAWATDAFVYEIYVRSFAADRSPFAAIRERLDYIASLGVDTLWLTPILENDHAPHGYNITDFFAVASDLGSRAEYERLVEAAHERDIAVLFDLVCNHSARTHPFFQDAVGNPDSDYRDWYEWRTETDPETYFEWEHIANFNFANLRVRRHLLDAFDEWIELVDGFRCDMAWAVPDGFWRELHDRCKAHDGEFLLLDETIPYIPDFQAGLFDVHFDSTTYFTLRQIGHGQDADSLVGAIEDRTDAGFPDHAGFMLYTENHDESRYVADCGRPAAEAAIGAVFTLPGAPMIYAGGEFGQRGRRDDLAWEHADDDLREHVRRLARLRREHPALSGEATVARHPYELHEGTPDRVTAYRTTTGSETVVVVLNFDDEPATVTVPDADGTDLLTDESVVVSDESAHGDTPISVENVVVLASRVTA